MDIPVTDEYALQRFNEALEVGDYDEVEKWKLYFKGNVEVRFAWKQKERRAKEAVLQSRLREMYSRP